MPGIDSPGTLAFGRAFATEAAPEAGEGLLEALQSCFLPAWHGWRVETPRYPPDPEDRQFLETNLIWHYITNFSP